MNQKKLIFVLLAFIAMSQLYAQKHSYYVRASSADFNPEILDIGGLLRTLDKDVSLKKLFVENRILKFEKAFPSSRKDKLQRTFIVETDSPQSLTEFTNKNAHLFEFGEYIGQDKIQLFNTYPNDYGQTGPQGPGDNLGLNLNLSAFDYAELPMAWDYTTGDPNLKVGISDGNVIPDNVEFDGKTTVLTPGPPANWHGMSVAALAAAQGNNEEFATGYCYDCPIVYTSYTQSYDGIIALSNAGAKVINCSWGSGTYSETRQMCIDEVYENGSVVVASSGNLKWSQYPGNFFNYPASYNHVISVATVGSKYQPLDSVYLEVVNGKYRANNVQNVVSYKIQFDENPAMNPNTGYDAVIANTITMNSAVDILAPAGVYRYSLLWNGAPPDPVYGYYNIMTTSSSAPQVTGTLGLMYSINNCMSFEEVESILKIASQNIDSIPANQFAAGNYGAGALRAGPAVKLTNDLIDPNETAYLQNQKFSRWDFVFNAVSEKVVVKNQEFTDKSTVHIVAKNEINLEPGTLIEPSANFALGDQFSLLEIDPALTIETNCPMGTIVWPPNKESNASEMAYKVYPTLVLDEINIKNVVSKDVVVRSVGIYDLSNQEVLKFEDIETSELKLLVTKLPQGIYVLKGYDRQEEVVLTQKFIKK